jgi:hypothetical protein
MRRKRTTLAEQIRLGAYFFSTGAIDLAIGQDYNRVLSSHNIW